MFRGCFGVVAQAQAAAELRRRREAASADELELAELFREWAIALCPEYAEGIAALPDATLRPTQYRNPEGYGQDPDEIRRQFRELVERERVEE